MIITDEQILKAYIQGWRDSSDNVTNLEEYNGILQTAYRKGWVDYIAGDDVSSVDEQTDEEILKNIHRQYNDTDTNNNFNKHNMDNI